MRKHWLRTTKSHLWMIQTCMHFSCHCTGTSHNDSTNLQMWKTRKVFKCIWLTEEMFLKPVVVHRTRQGRGPNLSVVEVVAPSPAMSIAPRPPPLGTSERLLEPAEKWDQYPPRRIQKVKVRITSLKNVCGDSNRLFGMFCWEHLPSGLWSARAMFLVSAVMMQLKATPKF